MYKILPPGRMTPMRGPGYTQGMYQVSSSSNMDKRKNWTRGVKNFSTWGVKPKNFERGSHQNSTRGVGPFFAKENFSGRGVKIFQLGESNSENLKGGVIKFQLGE